MGIFKPKEIDGYAAEYVSVGFYEIRTKQEKKDYKGVRFPTNTEMCILRDKNNEVVEIRYDDKNHSFERRPYGGDKSTWIMGNDNGYIVEFSNGNKDEYISEPSTNAFHSDGKPIIIHTKIATRNADGNELYTFDPKTGAVKYKDANGNVYRERTPEGFCFEYKYNSETKKYYKAIEQAPDGTKTEFTEDGRKFVTAYDNEKGTKTTLCYDKDGNIAHKIYEKGSAQIRVSKKGDELEIYVNGQKMSKEDLELKQEALRKLTGKNLGKTNPADVGKDNAKETAEKQAWASKILMETMSKQGRN